MTRPMHRNADGTQTQMNDTDYAIYLADRSRSISDATVVTNETERRAALLRRAMKLEKSGSTADLIEANRLRRLAGE